MKVKKYTAATMPEAMNSIRKELGPEAVILNSKEVQQGGILGFFKKKRIEVIAALDPEPLPQTVHKPVAIPQETLSSTVDTNKAVLNEVKHLKKMIASQTIAQNRSYPANYQIAYQHLLDQEMEQDIAESIINSVIEQYEAKQNQSNMAYVLQKVNEEINNRLSVLTFKGITYDKQIVHFVGPTGVGKTTTLAKVAANSILKDQKKVAFITADTYRMAAIEQLKTYARILDVPLEVVYTNDDYKNALDKFKSYDLILVDTAGRNFRDKKYVKELKEGLAVDQDSDIYLVLSLTAKPKDLTEIYEQFYHIPVKELIFTKIDETRQYGSIVNLAIKNQVGIAYLTNGQDVPDDLVYTTPKIISNLIVGAYDE